MKNLSIEQRNEVYVMAYKILKSGEENYICNAINLALDKLKRTKPKEYFYLNEISEETYIISPVGYPKTYSCITADTYHEHDIPRGDEAKKLRLILLQFCIEMTKTK